MNVAPDLRSKDSRREWEKAFSNSVVAPVLTVCRLYCNIIMNNDFILMLLDFLI